MVSDRLPPPKDHFAANVASLGAPTMARASSLFHAPDAKHANDAHARRNSPRRTCARRRTPQLPAFPTFKASALSDRVRADGLAVMLSTSVFMSRSRMPSGCHLAITQDRHSVGEREHFQLVRYVDNRVPSSSGREPTIETSLDARERQRVRHNEAGGHKRAPAIGFLLVGDLQIADDRLAADTAADPRQEGGASAGGNRSFKTLASDQEKCSR